MSSNDITAAEKANALTLQDPHYVISSLVYHATAGHGWKLYTKGMVAYAFIKTVLKPLVSGLVKNYLQ